MNIPKQKYPWYFKHRKSASGGGGGGGSWHPSAVAPLVLDANTLTGANGSAVANWASTGSNSSLVASVDTVSGGVAPTLSLAAQNGKNLVHFNGSTTFLVVIGITPSTDTAISFIGLFNSSLSSFGMMMVLRNSSTGAAWETRESAGANNWEWLVPNGTTTAAPTGSYTGWHIFESVKRTGDTAYMYQDAMSQGSFSCPYASNPVTGPSDLSIGARRTGNYWYLGDVAAIVLVSADLADSDRQKIEGWLANKWGLTSLLPAGHPYKTGPP